MEDAQQLDRLQKLPVEERLRLGRLLIESVRASAESLSVNSTGVDNRATNPLLALAGRYAVGAGDTAERAEEILEYESWRKNL